MRLNNSPKHPSHGESQAEIERLERIWLMGHSEMASLATVDLKSCTHSPFFSKICKLSFFTRPSSFALGPRLFSRGSRSLETSLTKSEILHRSEDKLADIYAVHYFANSLGGGDGPRTGIVASRKWAEEVLFLADHMPDEVLGGQCEATVAGWPEQTYRLKKWIRNRARISQCLFPWQVQNRCAVTQCIRPRIFFEKLPHSCGTRFWSNLNRASLMLGIVLGANNNLLFDWLGWSMK